MGPWITPCFHDDALDANIAKVIRGHLRGIYLDRLGDNFDEVAFKSMLTDFEGREIQLYYKMCNEYGQKPRDYGEIVEMAKGVSVKRQADTSAGGRAADPSTRPKTEHVDWNPDRAR